MPIAEILYASFQIFTSEAVNEVVAALDNSQTVYQAFQVIEQLAIARPKDIHHFDGKIINMMKSAEAYNSMAAQLLMKLAVDEVIKSSHLNSTTVLLIVLLYC